MNTFHTSVAHPFLHRSNLTAPFLKASLLLAVGLSCLGAVAPAHAQATDAAPRVDTQVQSDGVVFTAPGARSLRVRVLLGAREIFDSGPTEGARVEWDGRDEAGRWVADGVYVLQVATSDADGQITESRESIALRRAPLSSIGKMANPLGGGGTLGRIPKWLGPQTLGNSILFESAGKIGIGTTAPTAPLSVRGQIHSSLGGYKFPDGSTQITAGLPSVVHDLTLLGLGSTRSPLSIAPNRVTGVHLSANSVTGIKIAPKSVVKSLNGLFDGVTLVPGSNVTITKSGQTLVIAATVPPSGLASVAHDATLVGNGADAPLGIAPGGVGNVQLADGAASTSKIADGAVSNAKIANGAVTADKLAPGVGQVLAGGIGTAQLADGAVTSSKIADGAVTGTKIPGGQVVRGLNGLRDEVTLQAGPNVTVTAVGNTLTVAAPNALAGVAHDATLTGGGTGASPLGVASGGIGAAQLAPGAVTADKVAVPLALSGAVDGVGGVLSATNSGFGGTGVLGLSTGAGGYGVRGIYSGGDGGPDDLSRGSGVLGESAIFVGVYGKGGETGVRGSGTAYGVFGTSSDNIGVYGAGPTGVVGTTSVSTGFGVVGSNTNGGTGVNGEGDIGVQGFSLSDIKSGVLGINPGNGIGVSGTSVGGYGVFGQSTNSDGVYGTTGATGKSATTGIHTGNGIGVFGQAPAASGGVAGRFIGDVQITGTLSKGAGTFKIDHPLDPGNKYLSHSFVESPEMMNIYNGNVTTDAKGVAKVTMPDYFSALNREFRYQLTCIGTFAQAIVGQKIKGNQFVIKTDKPNVEVSWQVTGVRQDAYAKAHPIRVTEAKIGSERGAYLHPELFGQPKTKGIGYAQASGVQPKPVKAAAPKSKAVKRTAAR